MGILGKPLLLVIYLLLFLTFISAGSFGIFERSTDIELVQTCDDGTALCDYCNISSIDYPNTTNIISNVEMVAGASDFTYTVISNYTSTLGRYAVNGYCGDSDEVAVWRATFDVTANGKEKPEGVVIVFFTILFVILVIGLLVLLMYNIFHIFQWDFDANDLIFNIGAYFGLFMVYILGKEYLGNLFFDNFLVWVISVAAVTNVILPIIAFVLSFIKGGLDGGEEYL